MCKRNKWIYTLLERVCEKTRDIYEARSEIRFFSAYISSIETYVVRDWRECLEFEKIEIVFTCNIIYFGFGKESRFVDWWAHPHSFLSFRLDLAGYLAKVSLLTLIQDNLYESKHVFPYCLKIIYRENILSFDSRKRFVLLIWYSFSSMFLLFSFFLPYFFFFFFINIILGKALIFPC